MARAPTGVALACRAGVVGRGAPVLHYVALHEAAHLLELNHSPRYWAHVARVMPGWQAHRAWLRTHGHTL
ncbi:YgjP-like metallopeptidase domain-containing protein [Deinococcus sp. 6YEL10]|uniref:YgjP-like metallopeptidase domain-containing protein n=1 Tax=Deinococcus sp. 6YEL10 TaxID=2745870 RepID=UPI001E5F6F51